MIRQIRRKMSKNCNFILHPSSLTLFILILYFFGPLTVKPASAQEFYKGKTITIIAGTKAGDVYDLYARLIAQHMPKHIPGNPNIIVQNVAGAGSMIAANQVYAVAKPDGLTLGAIFPALYFDQLLKREQVQFDWAKFTWLGSPDKSNHLLYMRSDTPYKTIDDVRNAKESPKCGATGTSSTGYYMPKLVDELIGTKFNIILGYQSGGDVDLAVEKGELQCRSFTIAAFFAREPFFTWRKTGFVRVLFQTGRKKDERLRDVPTIYELMDKYKTPEDARRVATVILSAGDFGRPYVGPAGIPPDRVNILRAAFTKVVTDPAVIEEAKKRKLDIEPASGEELQTLAKEVIAQPPAVVERVKKVLGESDSK